VTVRRRRRLVLGIAVLAALTIVVGVLAIVSRSLAPETANASPATTTTVATTTTAPRATTTTVKSPEVPVSTTLAKPNGVIATYDGPGGQAIGEAGLWYGYEMTMPVVEDRGEWIRIALPERPNGLTGWVKRSDVTLSTTPYRIIVRLSTTSVTLYEAGYEKLTVPAGVGVERTPTPRGTYFVAVVEAPGPPGYGPLVLDLSAHSEAIQSWEGSGDAIVAIHGPISSSSDAQIGDTGTRISNGCIRLHEADQLKFYGVPTGTPVEIVG
jgi:lipoprotein-anchoring transpeptidase ErfK/SrfK